MLRTAVLPGRLSATTPAGLRSGGERRTPAGRHGRPNPSGRPARRRSLVRSRRSAAISPTQYPPSKAVRSAPFDGLRRAADVVYRGSWDVPGMSVVVGEVQIACLTDAVVEYPWPLAELFPGVSDEAWDPFRERYPEAFAARDVWRSWYRCFLLRSRGVTVLLDTGMGPAGSPLAGVFGSPGRLPEELRAAGVGSEDIDVVVLSHLHP